MAPSSRFSLGKGVIKGIEKAVGKLFANLKTRVLGGWGQPKGIRIAFNRDLTLPALFEAANREERNAPSEPLLDSILHSADGYLTALEQTTTTQVVKNVESFIKNAHASGKDIDFEQLLHGQLMDVLGKAKAGVRKIVDTEATGVRNLGTLDGIEKVNAAHGIPDPVVYFVVVRDNALCGECKRLHLLPDQITPRLWKQSDLDHNYHKKGEDRPSISGEHPHCRCSLVTLLPGFGFNQDGHVIYIGSGHDEYARQQSQE